MVSLQLDSATGRSRNRGLVAHLWGQATGFSKMQAGSQQADVTFSTNVFDDASMWLRDPVSNNAECKTWSNQVLQRLKDRLGPKGKNVHMPVLNSCENVFVSRHSYIMYRKLLLMSG